MKDSEGARTKAEMRFIHLILLRIDIEPLPDNEITKKCFAIYYPKKENKVKK